MFDVGVKREGHRCGERGTLRLISSPMVTDNGLRNFP